MSIVSFFSFYHINHDVHASTLVQIDHVLFIWLVAIEHAFLSLNTAFLFKTSKRTMMGRKSAFQFSTNALYEESINHTSGAGS
jgi:hypothetical protein